MQIYQDFQQIQKDQFSAIVAGAFFQMHKPCLKKVRELIARQPSLSLLFLDVFPAHSMAEYKLLLSAAERQQMLKELGAGAFMAVSEEAFREIYNAVGNWPAPMQGSPVLLCGLSEQGINPYIAQNFITSAFQTKAGFQWHLELGYYYPLSGKVVHGNQIGRKLGFPTANVKPDDPAKIIPPMGVYAGWVNQQGNWYKAMINIGIRPTLDLQNVTIEAHIFDFSADLYDREISIHFYQRIRDEMKFSSLDTLRIQLMKDQAQVQQLLNKQEVPVARGSFIPC